MKLRRTRLGYHLTKLLPLVILCNIFCIILMLHQTTLPRHLADNTYDTNMATFCTCSFEKVLVTFARFVELDGREPLESLLPEDCALVHPSKILSRRLTLSALNNAFVQLSKNCSRNRVKNGESLNDKNSSITLMTTHGKDGDGKIFKNTTFMNWSHLNAMKLLFSDHNILDKDSDSKLWYWFPITSSSNDGYPVLKAMFQTAFRMFRSDFFLYANSDILFDHSLQETLNRIKDAFDSNKPILIIGRRTNVYHITTEEANDLDLVRKISILRGKRFTTGAEDYIITTKMFQWTTVPDLVVGRVAYDNWLVAHARCTLRLDVIDASDTILAVHNTAEAGTWEAAQKHNYDYNVKVLRKLNEKLNFEAGLTNCAEWKTFKSLCGNIKVTRRDALPSSCRCV